MWMQGGLPTGALVANVVWAGVNLSLAQAVLRFTARLSRFTRREYRFPVPLPALLDFAESGSVAGVLDDVSSHGFKFYGRFPGNAAVVGARVQGEINLPSSKLHIQAEVRSLIHAGSADGHVKALGCRFRWDQESDRDELEVFLFGSNLQWRMNRLGERMRTPLEWITGAASERGREPRGGPEHWASALSRSSASAYAVPAVGLVSVPMDPSGNRTLVSYRLLADTAALRLDVVTRSGVHTLEGPAYFVDTVSNAGTLLHFYRFEARPQQQAPWRARP
jgi:PilZ domain